MSLSIRWKLILSISIPLLATYLGMLGWDYWRQRVSAMSQAQELVSERAQNTAAHLDTRLAAIMQVAESTASALDNRPSMTDAQIDALLQSTLRQNVWVASTVVALEADAPPVSAKRGHLAHRGARAREPSIRRRWPSFARGSGTSAEGLSRARMD